jgi:hypothetical protein
MKTATRDITVMAVLNEIESLIEIIVNLIILVEQKVIAVI